jgi:hypothetical protein
MKARYHALSGGIAAAALVPVLGPYSAVFLAASVLVDGDHYLDYLCRNRFQDFSVRNMFIFHNRLFEKGRAENFLGLNIGHTAECLLLVYGAGAVTGWTWLKAALWGMLFHLIVDLIYLLQQKRLKRRALSIIEYVIRWRRMKHRGLRPELPYTVTLRAMSGFSEGWMRENEPDN